MSRRKQENPQPRKRLVNPLEETSLSTTTTTTISTPVVGTQTDSSPREQQQQQQQLLCQDILVCGVCQREFALQDILKFISHKVNSCINKENCRINAFNNTSDDDLDDIHNDVLPVLNSEDNQTEIDSNINNLNNNIINNNSNNESNASPVMNLRKQTPSIINSTQRHKLIKLRHHRLHSHRSQQNLFNSSSRQCSQQSNTSPQSANPGAKRAQTVADAHTNTINSEPISQMCCTCKQVFSSSWLLIQHAQNIHGLKIYLDAFSSEPSILPPIDGHHSHTHSQSHSHSGSSGGHTSSQSIGSNALNASHHSALQLLRMPLSERQFPVQSFIAAAAAAAAGRSGGSVTSHSDIFGASNASSALNHSVSGMFSEAHNLFGTSGASDNTSTVKNSGVSSARHQSNTALALPPPPSLSFDTHLDFYSQRLRQLAGATSPAMSSTVGTNSTSPARKLTPPSYLQMTSTNTRTSPTVSLTTSTAALSDRSVTPNALIHPSSPKSKSCEFCGKSFRFMSNLIVHRRSHTGEKPYKCEICNHACTQQSKLKRHMKTHTRERNNITNTAIKNNNNCSENTTDSGNSGPDLSTPPKHNSMAPTNNTTNGGDIDLLDDEEDIDDDDDIEDEDEEVDDEGVDDNGDNSRASSTEMVAEDLSRTTGNTNGKVVSDNNSMAVIPSHTSRTSSAMQSLSLLGQVMENIGLSDIQQYNEAYKQALEESVKSVVGSANSGSSVKQERPSSSSSQLSSSEHNHNTSGLHINNILKHTTSHSSHHSHHSHHSSQHSSHSALSPHNQSFNELVAGIGSSVTSGGNAVVSPASSLLSSAFDHHNPFDPKRLKLDFSAASDQRDSLYAGLWLPSVAANPFTASFAHHLSAATDSAAAELVRNKVVDSAFSKNSSSMSTSSGSPRPGPSSSCRNLHTPPSHPIHSNSNNTSPTANSGRTAHTPPNSERQRKEHHTRSRNDTCEFCGKVFKNCSNLTVHRRSHTGEKPYKCELCSYACAQSSKLTRHMKTHGRLGKDVYKCRFCEMPFSVPSTLEKHMRKCVVNQNSAGLTGANSELALMAMHHTLSNTSTGSNDKDSDS